MNTNLKIFAQSKSLNLICTTPNTKSEDLESISANLKSDFDMVKISSNENFEMNIFIRTKNLKNIHFIKMTNERGTVVFTFNSFVLIRSPPFRRQDQAQVQLTLRKPLICILLPC